MATALFLGFLVNAGFTVWSIRRYVSETQLESVLAHLSGGYTTHPHRRLFGSLEYRVPPHWPLEVQSASHTLLPAHWPPIPDDGWKRERQVDWMGGPYSEYWWLDVEEASALGPPPPSISQWTSHKDYSVVIFRIGFPFRSSWFVVLDELLAIPNTIGDLPPPRSDTSSSNTICTIHVPSPWREQLGVSFLPSGVCAFALFANTFVFAALALPILLVVSGVLSRMRRWRMTQRGLCPTPGCAYERTGLGLSSPCPECGAQPIL